MPGTGMVEADSYPTWFEEVVECEKADQLPASETFSSSRPPAQPLSPGHGQEPAGCWDGDSLSQRKTPSHGSKGSILEETILPRYILLRCVSATKKTHRKSLVSILHLYKREYEIIILRARGIIRWPHGSEIGTNSRMNISFFFRSFRVSSWQLWRCRRFTQEEAESTDFEIRKGRHWFADSTNGFSGVAMQGGHQCHTVWHHTVRCFFFSVEKTKYKPGCVTCPGQAGHHIKDFNHDEFRPHVMDLNECHGCNL